MVGLLLIFMLLWPQEWIIARPQEWVLESTRCVRLDKQVGWEGCFVQLECKKLVIFLCNVSAACYSFLTFSPHRQGLYYLWSCWVLVQYQVNQCQLQLVYCLPCHRQQSTNHWKLNEDNFAECKHLSTLQFLVANFLSYLFKWWIFLSLN